jgi:hypothetical protein
MRALLANIARLQLLPPRVNSAALDKQYSLQVLIDMLHDDAERGSPPSRPYDFFLRFSRSSD